MNRHPHRKIALIYDGSCNLCAGNLHWLERLDWRGRFEAMPSQADEVYARFPQLSRAACDEAMHVVLEDGRVKSGAAAFREVFLRLPAMWLVGVFMCVPPVTCLLEKLYRKWAPLRHHFGGGCEVKRVSKEKTG